MVESIHTKIVQSVFAALGEGDLAKAAAFFDPKIRIYEPASLPYGGLYIGHAGFYELFQRLNETFNHLTIPGSP
jgi:ketosteroid isomerase-like protein